jgi:hypothetical protein
VGSRRGLASFPPRVCVRRVSSVPVSLSEYGRRQRSQLRLARLRACKNRMGGAERAGVGGGSGSGCGRGSSSGIGSSKAQLAKLV